MDIKKEDPSKVIIVPRPPRSINPDLVPLEPIAKEAEEDSAAVAAEEASLPASNTPVAVPDAGPLNNQVQGPAQGLAGFAKKNN